MSPPYKGCRFPAEVIAHCVWRYHRFPLSFGEAEELMPARGVIVSYKTVRQRCAKPGPEYTRGSRRRPPRPGGKRHLAEVLVNVERRDTVPVAGRCPERERP